MYTTKNRHSRSGSARSGRQTFSSSPSRRSKFHSGHPHRHSNKTGRSGSPASTAKRVGRGRPVGRFTGHPSRQNRGAKKMPTFDPSQFINTNPVDATSEIYTPKHSFGTFGLDARLVRAIASMRLNAPTPIQDQIIPEILKGRDVIGLAETGTGKTAAFLIPLVENTLKNLKKQTLILAPTRELALQIEEELRKLSRGLGIHSTTCVGGMNILRQIRALRSTNQFIIGTPGRILDLINRRCFMPGNVTTVVLDEADRMLDMGFIHDMESILSGTPKDRETLLFCATMSKGTEQLMHDFLNNPITVSVKKKDVTNSIEQDVVRFDYNKKFDALLALLTDPEFKRVLVFGSMKHSVEKLAKQLSENGVRAESIHGNKSHIQRQRALAKFKSGNAAVLVATDVAARGIHVDNVTHVINYDLPNTFEDYVHRIGRTGRATKHGKALTFVPANSNR